MASNDEGVRAVPLRRAARPKTTQLRRFFSVTQAVSPAAAAWVAERLWFTPPRAKIADEARAAFHAGREMRLDVSGRAIKARSFGEGPPIALMHGWGGYGAQLIDLVAPLVRAGHRAIVFDSLGHGESPPSSSGFRLATFYDFAAALRAIEDQAGPLHGLVAHSGGAVAAMLALRGGARVGRLVLIAPMSRPANYAAGFNQLLGLNDEVSLRWQARAKARLGVSFPELDVTAAADLPPPPSLVVHDRRDREVPFSDGEAIAQRWPRCELMPTDNLGHQRILHDPLVVRRCVDFLSRAEVEPAGSAKRAVL